MISQILCAIHRTGLGQRWMPKELKLTLTDNRMIRTTTYGAVVPSKTVKCRKSSVVVVCICNYFVS